jgi:polar amino acid transport system permease protein
MSRIRLVLLGLMLTMAGAAIVGALASPAAAMANTPPRIISTSPYKGMPSGWGGTSVSVTFWPAKMHGKVDPLSASQCQLWIGGVLARGVRSVVSEAPDGSTIQFSGFPPVPAGAARFRVVLATKSLQRAETSWEFVATGEKAPGLVNFSLMRTWAGYIARGTGWTLYITVVSTVLGCVLGLLGAFGRMMKTMTFRDAWQKHHSWLFMAEHILRMIPYWITTFYVSLFRGTPLLLQIYVVYYVVPAFINVMRYHSSIWNHVGYPSAIVSGIAALSLNYGAYLAEVFRGGIQSIPRGQTEAASALGMSRPLALRLIVLPQAFRVVMPTLGNYFISLIKDTSLLSAIAVAEILKRAQLVGGMYYDYLSPLLVAAIIYWCLTIFFSFWQGRLERRLHRDRARA